MTQQHNQARAGIRKWLEREGVDKTDWNGLITDFLKSENYTKADKYEFISRRFSKFRAFVFENTEEIK